MMGPRDAGTGLDRGRLPQVWLLASGLGLPDSCSIFQGSPVGNDLCAPDVGPLAFEDEPPPPSGWRGLPGEPVDELSHTGSWPG